VCAGVDPLYTQRWGDAELRPLVRDVEIEPLPAALDRMFVGVGPLAVRAPALPMSPAAARRSLAVLGKVAPAHDEVRGKPQEDPTAMREIFPDLFEPADGE
jgi:hypothetical protein